MATPLPETDLARIRRYCAARVPVEVQDQVRVEYRTRGRAVTILECRPPWREDLGSEWSELPVVRLKYDAEQAGWEMWWRDRNSRFHRYEPLPGPAPIAEVLAELEDDPTCLFWG